MADRAPRPSPERDSDPLGGASSAPPDREEVRRAGPLLIAGFLVLLGCALVLAVLATDVRRQELTELDRFGNPFMHALASPLLDAVMNAASFIGTDVMLLGIGAVAGLVLVRARRDREAVFLGVALIGSILLNLGMKLFFHRARPSLPWATVIPDYSFPSGHSMNSLAFGLALALIVWRLFGPRWGAASLVLAFLGAGLIGLSRIYLGYHYVTDVVGGYATAALWVGIVVAVFRAVAPRRRDADRLRTRLLPR